jgi:uncharacterized protein YjbI with pentapeptide repeats
MELINLPTFKESSRQARNVEESLMVVLHACALVTEKISNIAWPKSESSVTTSFGELLSRLQGQREDWVVFILRHLRFLNLKSQFLLLRDFFGADLRDADLHYAVLRYANLSNADLSDANLRDADLSNTDLSNTDLSNTDLRYADLRNANLHYAYLRDANLSDADLRYADLRYANLSHVVLTGVKFNERTNFVGVRFEGANFESDEQKQAILRLAKPEAEDFSLPDDFWRQDE